MSLTATPSLLALGHLEAELERVVRRTVDVVDVDQATTLLRWEVVRTGRVICSRDWPALVAFRARVPLEYFDLKPHLERQAAGLRQALAAGR